MTGGSYQQFCPVAMAAEVLGARWTIVLIRELVAGSTRFNELRRGVPRMSPALLSKRLKELEDCGVVQRRPVPREPEVMEYRLTRSGKELAPIIEAIGIWGHRWTETKPQLENLDAELLMWDMRRNIQVPELPARRNVIQFIYPEHRAAERNWWIVVDPKSGADLCRVEPGFNVDLFVRTDLRTMTAIWMGLDTVTKAVDDGRLALTGDKELQKNLLKWLGLSTLAGVKKQVA
ncbi:helix-turn-helix transcriptional regulator [Pelagibius litoralis]|uniref:Helix-turn-helix transcriptional regulator n=1 Tax=Pelagibius litoralis TaxID=374515 RepID=A0A967C4S0_9PROT|nr:helix-turn-helix domain-containing protein [Pelagibius litoralis]NIA68664.1 helix-turn-helix transcriptional regulator [Pelagibius litoralis]